MFVIKKENSMKKKVNTQHAINMKIWMKIKFLEKHDSPKIDSRGERKPE